MSSSGSGLSSYTRVAMLKHLIDGRSVDFAAAAAGVKRDRALEVVTQHGYPDKVAMLRRIAAMERDRVAREIAVLQSRISQLQASVAPAKKSRGATTVKSGSVPAAAVSLVCDVAGCGRVFESSQGLQMHRRRAHEGWGHNATRARPSRTDATIGGQQ